MNRITTAGPTTGRLKETTTVQAITNLDIDRAQTHEAACFVLLLDFFDDGSGKDFDLGSRDGGGFRRG